jgi:hypothetical protein
MPAQRKWDLARAVKLRKEGWLLRQIAEEMGVSFGTVRVALSRCPVNDMPAYRTRIDRRRLDWCPAEYRGLYHALVAKGLAAAEARRMIRDQIVVDARRQEAAERERRAA